MAQTVLIADNDSVMRGILRSIFMGLEQAVCMAASGLEVLQLVQSVDVKLFVLDLDMPGLDGLQTCEMLRASVRHARTPIAILTALDTRDARKACEYAGATLFLGKPVRPASLIEALTPYLAGCTATVPASPPRRW